jgi:tetratricopeptide (TPR) repeat protein
MGLELLLFAASSAVGQDKDLGQKIYSENSPSVVLLYVQSGSGAFVAQGSGFCIEGQKIVTNAHVANAGKVFLELGPARVPAHVEKVDPTNDLAILTVEVELSSKALTLAKKAPAPGEAVFAITNPEGLERTISQGIISSLRDIGGKQLMQISAPISPGSSGGPIFNTAGEVIGVAVGTLETGQNLNFAVPVLSVRKLLENKAPGGGSGTLVDLQQAELLRIERDNETYSEDSNSPYQKKDAEVRALLRRAFEDAGRDPGMLARVSKEAQFVDADLAVLAAERSVEVNPAADSQLLLAQMLSWKAAFLQETKEQQKMLRQAESAARASVSATRSPSPEMYYTLGEILTSEESYKEAEKYYRLALPVSQKSADPDLPAQITRGLVTCAYETNKPDEGQRWFDALVALEKANPWDWRFQGDRLSTLRRYQEAGDAYARAAALLPGNYNNLCLASQSYYFASQPDLALSWGRKCIEIGTGKKGSEANLARAHSVIAAVLNGRGVYSEALNHAKEATEMNPSDAFAFDTLAESLIGLRRFYEAVNAEQQAIRLSDGKFGFMHFRLGSAYFKLENWDLASQSFQKAV